MLESVLLEHRSAGWRTINPRDTSVDKYRNFLHWLAKGGARGLRRPVPPARHQFSRERFSGFFEASGRPIDEGTAPEGEPGVLEHSFTLNLPRPTNCRQAQARPGVERRLLQQSEAPFAVGGFWGRGVAHPGRAGCSEAKPNQICLLFPFGPSRRCLSTSIQLQAGNPNLWQRRLHQL